MDYAQARHNMVENQLRTNRVVDQRVVQALDEVPREKFVPNQLRGIAYIDDCIELGADRSLMEPRVFARLLQAAGVGCSDVVLDIGCGTGYSAAILARLASTVVAVESDAEMAARAGELLAELAADNVAVVVGPLAAGDASHGPYDVILFEGAVAAIPDELPRQLSDGGRLVAVVAGESGLGRATLMVRVGDVFSNRVLFDATIGMLPGFQRATSFVF